VWFGIDEGSDLIRPRAVLFRGNFAAESASTGVIAGHRADRDRAPHHPRRRGGSARRQARHRPMEKWRKNHESVRTTPWVAVGKPISFQISLPIDNLWLI